MATTVFFVILGLLFLLIFLKVPIGIAMFSAGFVGFAYLVGLGPALSMAGRDTYDTIVNYDLTVIALFVLMGQICFYSGSGSKLYTAMYKLLGGLPGGLAMATIAACACFAAISGSSLATAATIGTVALPEMKKFKYAPSLSTGCVAAGGTLGILIPPSTIFILYGVMVQESIVKLFVAGILPGILLAGLFIIATTITVLRNPSLAPRAPYSSIKDKIKGLAGVIDTLMLFTIIMGGLFLGYFTPNEGAAIGGTGALIIGLVRRQLSWAGFKKAVFETAQTTGMLFLILVGAFVFGRFLAVTNMPYVIASFTKELAFSPYVIFGLMMVVYLILGCFFESLSLLVLTIPLVYPMIIALGFDSIWFGVMVVLIDEMALVTPPVGLNVYVIAGIAPDVPMGTIFRGIIPFLLAMIVCVILLTIFPQIALFLPSSMK